MKRSISVDIAGQRYSLRSDGDDAFVLKIASEVDARIRSIMQTGKGVDTQQVATLAALQFAEALERERQAHALLKARVRDRGEALLKLIDWHAAV